MNEARRETRTSTKRQRQRAERGIEFQNTLRDKGNELAHVRKIGDQAFALLDKPLVQASEDNNAGKQSSASGDASAASGGGGAAVVVAKLVVNFAKSDWSSVGEAQKSQSGRAGGLARDAREAAKASARESQELGEELRQLREIARSNKPV